MLKRFDIKACKLAKTPITKKTLIKAPLNYKTPKALLKDYKKLKNSLMHLIIKTKSNIYYIILQFGQFSNNLINKHYTQLKRVLHYIRNIMDMEIAYKKDKNITINM